MSNLPQDDAKNPGIKRSYYPLPVENPPGWRCVEVHIPDGDEYMELLRTVLKSLTLWFNYARDIEHRGKLIADRFRYSLQLPELGCDMNCEELMECLAPLFESVETISQNLQELKEQVEQSLSANAAKLPEVIDTELCEAAYPGALALVKEMHKNNQKYYDEAESSLVDNASEALSILIELFPQFAGQTYDEGFELGNAYFENQVLAYNTAYDDFELPAACSLMQAVIINGGQLTVDVWGDWLFDLPTLLPSNAAAAVFTRYSPLRQTFFNQIAEFFNQEQSLKSYFDGLWQVYNAGTKVPVVELPEGCDCVEPEIGTPELTDDWEDGLIGGTDLTDLGGGYWEITSTEMPGGGYSIGIQESLGGEFYLVDVTYPDGTEAACFAARFDDVLSVRCESEPLPGIYDRFGWTWIAAQGVQRVRFQLFKAV